MKIVFWRSAPTTADDSRLSTWGDCKLSARVWFKEIALEIDRDLSISFSFITYLLWLSGQTDNSRVEPRPIDFEWDFTFKLKPSVKSWCKLCSYHGYYDGAHCSYHFGPFSYYTNKNVNCKKCDPDE